MLETQGANNNVTYRFSPYRPPFTTKIDIMVVKRTISPLVF